MPSEAFPSLVFVDLETTGGAASADRITEIGIVEWHADGRVERWTSLVNPEAPIPPFIQSLTGITDEMVAQAPTFEELADEVLARLQGRLFVAHNARFDYGFVKQSFARSGRAFSAMVLCTVKLSRRLYPEFKRHGLDALIERHGLQVPARHRALADAEVLLQFWRSLHGQFGEAAVREAVDELTGVGHWPAQLDISQLASLHEGHGVFVLYGDDDQPLHVGKGHDVRQKVLAHFRADDKLPPTRRYAHLVKRLEAIEASGEWGAALLEARLRQALRPVRDSAGKELLDEQACTWRRVPAQDPAQPHAFSLALQPAEACTWRDGDEAYGLYATRKDALKALRDIARNAQLCLATLDVEPRRADKPCEAFETHQCSGVCIGRESLEAHAVRFRSVMAPSSLPSWPHPGPVAVQEGEVWHILDAWRYLGSVAELAQAPGLISQQALPPFDRKTHKLVSTWLAEDGCRPRLLLDTIAVA